MQFNNMGVSYMGMLHGSFYNAEKDREFNTDDPRKGDIVVFDKPLRIGNSFHQTLIFSGEKIKFLTTAGGTVALPGWKVLPHSVFNEHNDGITPLRY